jgi:hypothetical protein
MIKSVVLDVSSAHYLTEKTTNQPTESSWALDSKNNKRRLWALIPKAFIFLTISEIFV